MTPPAAFNEALSASRPRAVGALLRYFRNLDWAEDAYQEACLRALKSWPESGLPRDPAAWLIFVGRNVALDAVRRQSYQEELPPEHLLSNLDDAERAAAEMIDRSHYRDDILRLLFICCQPELPANQQVALALRVVSGLSVREIARAFLVSETAMEQRITRAKRRVASTGLPFETPGAAERSERLASVAAMIYLLFNEGYSASGGEVHVRVPLCEEAIRLARLLVRLFESEPEILGLAALLVLQHSRAGARTDGDGKIVLLEDQDRRLWDRTLIAEGHELVHRALLQKRPGPYQVQAAIAAVHSQAERPQDTDWAEIDRLYASLETLQPSPVVTLNRAVAVAKVHGPAAAVAMIEPLEPQLANYSLFYGLKGALLGQLGRTGEARSALEQALDLANTPAEADHFREQIERLPGDRASA